MENTLQKPKNDKLILGKSKTNTPSETMLIINIKRRSNELEKISNLLSENLEQNTLSSSHQKYLNFLSKEKNRTHQQLLSTLEVLRRIKTPSLKINVNTQSAFLAQNQINALK